jgi:hypothetical protein
MNRRLTRREAAKLLAAAPIALAIPEAAFPAEPKRPATPPLTEKQKRAIAKGSADLKKALGALHKMPIPMGTEPAFVFSPIVRKK